MQRLKAKDFARIAVRLLFVHINDIYQVRQAVVGRRHRRFPGRPFVQLPIRHGVINPGCAALLPQAERHPDGNGEPLPQRAAGHLHPRRIGCHTRHRQTAVVGAVGLQLLLRDNFRFQQRRIIGDGVMAVREQEAVASFPLRLFRAVAHRVAERGGQHIRIA